MLFIVFLGSLLLKDSWEELYMPTSRLMLQALTQGRKAKPNSLPQKGSRSSKGKKIHEKLGRRFDLHCLSIVNASFVAKETGRF